MFANTLCAAIIFRLVTAINVTKTNEKILELEKEKNELYKQINQAIDESVKSLQKSNETDALVGIKYMSDLKEYLNIINGSVLDDNFEKVTNNSDTDNRRKYKKLINKKKSNDPFDFESVVAPKKVSEARWNEIMRDRAKMQKQLNEWILNREKEKDRIEKYRLYQKGMLMSGKYEKCPRFGYQGKKKSATRNRDRIRHCKEKITSSDSDEEVKKCIKIKSKNKTASDDDIIKYAPRKRSRKNKYPCCRKCCKKSYMGCL